ncbi:minor capsid protein [Atopococcus tabaci]|uniref:minor capsid protein n=1 Tax=Atopococcus tabaci TaxID=269774 RepID=UPI0024090DEC|nr:minor capsid protein [Atopococcus tabaci]
MIQMNVTVDLKNMHINLDKRKKKMQLVLDQQVAKDSNYFIPMDEGTLADSVFLASQFGRGKVIWDVPYARRLYWNPNYNFSRDRNPNAQGLWLEAAKAMFISDWVKILEKVR